MIDKKKIVEDYYKCLDDGLDCVHNIDLIFWRLFHKKMVGYKFQYKDGKVVCELLSSTDYQEIIFVKHDDVIDYKKFIDNIYANEDCVTIDYRNYYETGTLIIGENYIINKADNESINYIFLIADSNFDVDRFSNYIERADFEEESVICNIVTVTPRGVFESNRFPITRNVDIDIKLNYNDDLPYEGIIEFCKSDECGLTLFYGEPGTGKSTFLKHLISLHDTNFFLMDSSLLSNITQSSFLQFLVNECKNCVIILEDCEKLLVSRDLTHNPILGTLLNLSDGMLGDALNVKFICTFNTDISNIDKAALRKGRLKISYKFGKLNKDKAKELGKVIGVDINEPMTLADIYNQKEIKFGEKKQTKIGF